MARTTWKAPRGAGHGQLDEKARDALPDSAFAFPSQRKEPLTDAGHVRAALARFDQVHDVDDDDRELAFANIRAAAEHFGVEVAERSWRDLGRAPHGRNPAHERGRH